MLDPLGSADCLSPDEVAQLVGKLFDRWQLDEQARRRLLGTDREAIAATPPTALTPEQLDRARVLLGIHAGLRLLFPENSAIRWSWVHRRNGAFDGRAPLDLLLEGGEGIARVSRHVRSDLAT
ncbi:antitoxin Xre/MbcA/ParS toxin-binding domain-containing protein [Lysobacter korlensis]|uniref:Antitoxin Xre/MbcA/ParS toxin-binding domain-containing protein n=1 Tax=Lysobacter korlensis TaxID=553636 RepID=A0ABV6RS70_9GAMM